MPEVCARQFLRVATELDQYAQRLELLETVTAILGRRAGLPF